MKIDPELQTALKVFRHFFDKLGYPLAIINQDTQHVYYNKENAALDEEQQNLVLGQPMQKIFPNIKAQENEMLQALYSGKESLAHEKTYYNSSSKLIHYRHTTIPLFNSKDEIIGVIEAGQDMSPLNVLNEQVVKLNERLYETPVAKHKIVYESQVMGDILRKVDRLANSDIPIMIIGETGTGKELFAQRIYQHSKRKKKPFIALNCAALPVSLIESTLFGSVKGAFTGAENRRGYFELAAGGTILLDELNSMPMEVQSKLLRLLQEKTFWKLGSAQEQTSDVRIICAMNEAPLKMIEQGRLRADLYYRLEVGLISIPPLRERKEDILPLANYFIQKHKENKKITGVDKLAEKELLDQSWKGNVRMLENVIVRSILMQDNGSTLSRLFFNDHENDQELITKPEEKNSAHLSSLSHFLLTEKIEVYERALLVEALTKENGSVAATAKAIGISRGALQYKIQKYKIKLTVVENKC